MLLLRALSARSYTAIAIGWKEIKLHGYRAENAMKHRDADRLGRSMRDRTALGSLKLQLQPRRRGNLPSHPRQLLPTHANM
jgi:hypothetical protein